MSPFETGILYIREQNRNTIRYFTPVHTRLLYFLEPSIMSLTTLTETEHETNQASATYKLRATAKWVKKSFWERNLWENLASIDLASKKCYEVQPKNPNAPPTHNLWPERLWLVYAISPSTSYSSSLVSFGT